MMLLTKLFLFYYTFSYLFTVSSITEEWKKELENPKNNVYLKIAGILLIMIYSSVRSLFYLPIELGKMVSKYNKN